MTEETEMRKKILFAVCSVWSAFFAFISPIIVGFIYMQITGHGKGYDYDLGPERDISVAFGAFSLLIWLSLIVPPMLYIMLRAMNRNKILIIIPICLWILIFISGIFFIGGFDQFLLFFNIKV